MQMIEFNMSVVTNVFVVVKKVSLSLVTLAVFVFSSHMVGEALFLCQLRNQKCLFYDASFVFTMTNSLFDHGQVDVFEKEVIF